MTLKDLFPTHEAPPEPEDVIRALADLIREQLTTSEETRNETVSHSPH